MLTLHYATWKERMSLPLSARVKKVKPSATMAVTARARELGEDFLAEK